MLQLFPTLLRPFPVTAMQMASQAYGIRQGSQRPTHWFVLDFEATCDDKQQVLPQEIIEFPVVAVDATSHEVVATFRRYVRPKRNPVLTPFCTELTGIQQHQVELKHGALDLADALTDFDAWTVQHGFVNGGSNSDCCPPADSDSPLLQQEQEQALEGNTVMDPGSHGIRYQHQPTNDDRVQSTSHQGSTSQVQQVPTGSCCSSSGRRGACVPLLVTCGDWDLKHLHKEAGARGIRLPPIWHTFCNVKVPFERWMDMQQEAGSGSGLRGGAGGHKGRSKKSRDSKRSHGMMGMLAALGLPHVGRHHSGLDDAHNIARIAMELDRRGVGLQPTGHIDPNTGTFVRLA